MKKLLISLLALLECVVFPGILLYFFLKIRFVELIYHIVGENAIAGNPRLLISFLLLVALLFLALKRYFKEEKFERLVLAAFPLTLPGVLFFLPLTFFSFIFFTVMVSLAVYRIFNAFEITIPDHERFSGLATGIVFAGAAAGAAYGIFMQFDAMNRLYLGFSDWSIYAIAYGEFARDPASLFPGALNVGGHFNPLPNLIGTLIFCFTHHPEAVFFLNSLLIYSVVPCAFFLARACKVPPVHSMLFALALLLHFTPANLNLALFYGYHPSIFLPILFLSGTIFAVKKQYKTAAVFFILSLLVQETFAVFYFGIGFAMVLFRSGKQRKAGIGIMLFMLGWFFLVSRGLMSIGNADNAENYQQMFHYSNLGRTIPEILLSPLQKPAVFFKDLFAVENFYFTGMLLAGFYLACLPDFQMLAGILPALAGVFLLNGVELGNVAMQYQTEFFTLLVAVAASGLGSRLKKSPVRLSAATAATVAGIFFCGMFAGRLPYGYSSYPSLVNNHPDRSLAIREIKKVIPPGSVIQSSLGYQGHFINRNKLINFSGIEVSPEAQYIIAPLRDFMDNREHIVPRIEKLLSDPRFRLIMQDPTPGAEVWIFKRMI